MRVHDRSTKRGVLIGIVKPERRTLLAICVAPTEVLPMVLRMHGSTTPSGTSAGRLRLRDAPSLGLAPVFRTPPPRR